MMKYLKTVKIKNIYRKLRRQPDNTINIPNIETNKEFKHIEEFDTTKFIVTPEKTLATMKIQSIMCKRLRTCPICYDCFMKRNHIMVLSCGHFIHRECFTKLERYGYIFCPFCKTDILQLKRRSFDKIMTIG